ncbi:MAG TPA: DUF4136 domain-containing protein [Steroidobacteraceae bacterium]|nr:DUF4136 domain-containing protein [Steroidobacteraceae bacterium]
MNLPGLASTAAIVVLLAGCASPWAVDEFEAPEADIATRASFAWKSGDIATGVPVGAKLSADADERLRMTIVEGLLGKGYLRSSGSGPADMLISYQLAGSQKFVIADDRRIGAPLPSEVMDPGRANLPPLSATAVPEEQTLRQGSLIVFADDPATGQLLWRGRITSEGRVTSREAGLRTLVDMAKRIVAEFPPRRAPH